jgi:regulator of sirC expression with transglutaminase-like and TPR domain
MKKISVVLLILVFVSISFAQEKYEGQTIEQILELPEEEINIGIATLVLAKEFQPNIDVNNFLHIFDYMSDRFNYFFGKYADPDSQIRALNTYLYQKGYWNDGITFGYDDEDLHVTKLSNKLINGYIATKKGSCITMPMLYLILGERLGWPLYAVRSARHYFVRYIPKGISTNFQANIETTNGGGYFSDDEYIKSVNIPNNAIENGVYLRTLTKKEYIASLLITNANEYLYQGDVEKAKRYYETSLKYDPTLSISYWNYGLIHLAEARQLEEKMYSEKQSEIFVYHTMDKAKSQNELLIPKPNKYKKKSVYDHIQSFSFHSPLEMKENEQSKIHESQPPVYNGKPFQMSNELRQELDLALIEIEEKYKTKILEKIAIYRVHKNKADSLGIVHKFPIEFFKKQAESIEKFKEKGGY